MSTFKVEQRTISRIYPHPNADKLELAQVEGMTFQFVIKKGDFIEGDKVVYFPIDSCFPLPLVEHLGIGNLLAKQSRIKTVKLRGEISQGFVTKPESIHNFLNREFNHETLTEDLGITKYEPPAIMVKGANLHHMPGYIYVYDIEGCDRYPQIVEMLMDKHVWITEKMEGMNYGISINTEDVFVANTRHHTVHNLPGFEEHSFWKIAKSHGFLDLLTNLRSLYLMTNITLRGEFLGPGVQGNYYGLKDHTVRLFEMDVNGQPVDSPTFIRLMKEYGVEDKLVPTLGYDVTLRQWLDGKTVQQASNGKSTMVDRLREGIVIKPLVEDEIHGFGRLFIKQRSPEYLSKTEN